MYERYFGLTERPFEITPNPRYLVLTPSHREALSNLEYGIAARKGITLLIGEAGTGKTTLLRKALSLKVRPGDASSVGWIYVNNPTLTRQELFEVLAAGFALGADALASKPRLLSELERVLCERHRSGLANALIVDEAQSLPYDLLEELRLLGNMTSDTEALLPLVLAGQPELADRLNEPGMRQFKQRIALRCRLSPLTLTETAAYLATRIRLAGGDPASVFSRDAVMAIHQASRGIPRTISVISDNALLNGFAADQRPVGAGIVREVCADFDLPVSDASNPELEGRPSLAVRGQGPRAAAVRRS
jgi:general secretion pathway protein A